MTKVHENPVEALIQTMLWSSPDLDSDTPLDANFGNSDVAPETRAYLEARWTAFWERAQPLLTEAEASEPGMVAHNFWLTSQRHGAGFRDGGYGRGRELGALAQEVMPELDPYDGEDGKVYIDIPRR